MTSISDLIDHEAEAIAARLTPLDALVLLTHCEALRGLTRDDPEVRAARLVIRNRVAEIRQALR